MQEIKKDAAVSVGSVDGYDRAVKKDFLLTKMKVVIRIRPKSKNEYESNDNQTVISGNTKEIQVEVM